MQGLRLRPSRPPRQYLTDTTRLDEDNIVIAVQNVLSDEELNRYVERANQVDRRRGPTAFGNVKPRREVCYTTTGSPFRYSRVQHHTLQYPDHVMELIPIFLDVAGAELTTFLDSDEELYLDDYELSHGVDIVYSCEYPGSGSIGAHSDDELDWPLIIVYSLGQTRYFRIRDKDTGRFTNFEIPHNSVLAMYGNTFQQRYTHQIDRLKSDDEPFDRHSLNIRFTHPSTA